MNRTSLSQNLPPRLRDFFRNWYNSHGRVFPWRRRGVSIFGLLIAEVLLRQTRAETVQEIWPRIRRAYPTPYKLACARHDRLLQLVKPLGLQEQRVTALTLLARALVDRHGGEVPRALNDLLNLPHVGIYAASAVRVFAYGEIEPVLDTNVVRVLSRLTGETLGPDPRRDPRIARLAWEILPDEGAKEHNYGILDFAAMVCKSRRPVCGSCPLADNCRYAAQLSGT